MPWSISKGGGTCSAAEWAVLKNDDGSTAGCHDTEDAAKAQLAALYANEGGRAVKRETRERIGGELRAIEEDGKHYVTLQAITPGVVDDYGSVWSARTFDAASEKRLPVLCWGHDWAEPLGHAVDYQGSDDGPRIKFVFDNFEDVPMARRAFSQVQSGTLQDCSVGFCNTTRRDPTDEEREAMPGVREIIEESTLDEVSLVVRGAVPGAKVLAMRSAEGIRQIPEDTVVDLAKQVIAGKITNEEAKVALDLLTPEQKPNGKTDDEKKAELDAAKALAEAEAEADAVLQGDA